MAWLKPKFLNVWRYSLARFRLELPKPVILKVAKRPNPHECRYTYKYPNFSKISRLDYTIKSIPDYIVY